MAKSAFNPKSGKAPAQDTKRLPLFFKRPVPLDSTRHASAGLLPSQNFTFAAKTNSILVNVTEFFEAARHYPIVFTLSESPFPTAIVGLEDRNYFVNDKGQWKEGTYLPAYVRKYPFIFMDMPEQRDQLLLCIDEAAPQYKENAGKEAVALYNNGTPSEFAKSALDFCGAFHQQHQLTTQFCEAIQAADLLVATHSAIKLHNGRNTKLSGFQVIDEKKFRDLPEKTIMEFFKKNWLPFIYIMLMSTSNWQRLVDMEKSLKKTKTN